MKISNSSQLVFQISDKYVLKARLPSIKYSPTLQERPSSDTSHSEQSGEVKVQTHLYLDDIITVILC